MPDNPDYENYVKPNLGVVDSRLKGCATNKFYAKAIDHNGILYAFQDVFEVIKGSAPLRLTK